MTEDRSSVVVVGAGIAGVACAVELTRAGVPVQIRERGHVCGGRMASKRFQGRPADIGAAYFTATDPDFAALVEQWRAAGLVREWTDTFQAYDRSGNHEVPGPMRFAAPRGLRSLVEHLAGPVPVTVDRLVLTVEPGPVVDGQSCAAVALAMPGPQAALLLDPALTEATRVVQAQRWSPSLAAVLRFPTRRWPDFRGAFVNEHPVLNLVCDDGDRRGDGAPVLVAHTVPEFAAGHLAQPTGAGPAIEQAVRDLLGLPEQAVDVHVHRWTYAKPTSDAGGATHHLDADGIGLAGDAFGKPRVQSAWRSGRDLGRALAARLA
ncbi:hypothetical protein LUPAC06_01116 [Micromonospora saelicesensis]|nr:hypothetical protein LUPAC06_01116 [Micromonospora saelicesensis]